MLLIDRICSVVPSYLNKLWPQIWPLCSLLALLLFSPISSVAQTQGASSYLTQINQTTIEQLLELGRQGNPHSSVSIDLPTNDGFIEATLVLNQIQSAKHFKSVETSAQGIKEVKDEVYSYKSVVLNTSNAGDFLRLTINVNPAGDYWVYGLLKANGVPYSIILSSQLSKSSPLILSAQSASGVNVTVAELSQEEGQSMLSACGVAHADEALEALFSNETLPQIAAASCPQVVQIATDADFEYFQAKGSIAGVNSRIQAILNGVEAIYQSHFNISFQITFQNVFTTAADPYTSTVAEDLLFQFTNHWNANFRSSKTYDIAHLWTGKVLQQGTIGVAFVAAVCSDFNYGLSQLFLSDSDAFAIPLTAHEIGHNFGANHGACIPSNLIMCATIQSGANQFSSVSQAEINAALPAFSCLSCAAGSFTITGTIFDGSGNRIQGVNVSGGSLGNVTSDFNGEYIFANVPAATYTITPTKASFTFSPSSASVTVSSANVSRNFTGTLQGFTISGSVTDQSNNPVSGVTISAGLGRSTSTSGTGAYSLTVVPGTYTVTPSKIGFTFVPTSVTVTVVNQNLSRSFIAIPIQAPTTITGTVLQNGNPLQTVSVNGGSLGIVNTNSSGVYSFTNVLAGSYTLTPSKIGFTFSPTSAGVTVTTTNKIQDFAASAVVSTFTITGTILQNGSPLQAVSVNGGSLGIVNTNSSGVYSFTNVLAGSYTLTPSKIGFTFSPTSAGVTVTTTNKIQDFAASAVVSTFTITGTILQNGSPLQAVSVNGGSLGIVNTNSSGVYSFTNVLAGSYTLTPSKIGFTFNPPSASVIVSNANKTQNFIASAIVSSLTISGVVSTDAGTPISGVTISAGVAGSVVTNDSGAYSLTVTPGSYNLVPSKIGFTFIPFTITETVTTQSIIRNFTAIQLSGSTFTISGVIRDSSQLQVAVPGVSVSVSGLGTVLTNSSGAYQFSNVPNGNYTITPTKLNFIFNPSASIVNVNGANVSRDFSASCALGFIKEGNDCVIPAELPPVAPTNVQASDGTNDQHVRVTWVASAQASALTGDILAAGEPITYTIYRSNTLGVLGTAIVSGLTNTAFNDTSAAPLIIYFYSVKAVRGVLESVASNQTSGFRAANGSSDVDTDGDGVNDSLEQAEGSDPADAGSFKLHLGSPAYIKYNTFLSQFNFLELVSTGLFETDFFVTVYKINGQVAGKRTIRLAPLEQFDVDINSIVNQQDTYGVVRVDFNPEAGEALVGRMSNYRLNPDGATYSFVLTHELRNPVKGSTYATGNSIDPQGQGFLVPNWAEIINLSTTNKTFTYNLYGQSGALLSSAFVSIPSLGEVDIQAGHEFGQGVYLSEIIPHDSNTAYLAGVARYSSNAAAGTEASTYNFAIYLDGRKGTGDTLFAPTSNLVGGCWSQSNFIEVANTLSQPVTISVLFRNEAGAFIGSDSQVLAAKSQFHFHASAILGKGQIGSVEINSSHKESVISQSAVYFHDCAVNALQTAYATQARVGLSTDLAGTYNRFLSMSNKFQLIGVANGAQSATLQVRSSGVLLGEFAYSLGNSGSTKIFQTDVNQVTFPDTYGTLALSVAQPSKAVANLIRFREVFGRADFAVSTPVQ